MSEQNENELPDTDDESLEELQDKRAFSGSPKIDADLEDAESFDLPDLDTVESHDTEVRVIPVQNDEFICSNCHLVMHRSGRHVLEDGSVICRDCVD